MTLLWTVFATSRSNSFWSWYLRAQVKYQTVQHLRGHMLRSGCRQGWHKKTVRPLRRTSSNKEVPQRHRMGLPRLSIVCSKLLRFLQYDRFHVADSRGNNVGIIERNTNSRRNEMPGLWDETLYDRLTFKHRLSLVEGRFRPQGFW